MDSGRVRGFTGVLGWVVRSSLHSRLIEALALAGCRSRVGCLAYSGTFEGGNPAVVCSLFQRQCLWQYGGIELLDSRPQGWPLGGAGFFGHGGIGLWVLGVRCVLERSVVGLLLVCVRFLGLLLVCACCLMSGCSGRSLFLGSAWCAQHSLAWSGDGSRSRERERDEVDSCPDREVLSLR
jgi:hypothetical protein